MSSAARKVKERAHRMADFDYDLFVIGGGSGGVRAARVAAGETGAKVALAEEDRYGGTCVIRGCVPKKLMVFASEYAQMPEQARQYGWDIQDGPFDWQAFKTKLNAERDRLEGIYRSLLKNAGVDSFDARATLKDEHTVALSDGREISAKHILIASGGRPVRPDLPGAEFGIVSDDIFHLPELPKSILIVGGGYIACEFAGIMTGLGVKVTQFYRGEQVLRGFDNEAREIIADGMRQHGVDLRVGTTIFKMAPVSGTSGPIQVTATDGREEVFDTVLFATGRRPNSDEMGLESLGIALGHSGAISVNESSPTGVPAVYAIGD